MTSIKLYKKCIAYDFYLPVPNRGVNAPVKISSVKYALGVLTVDYSGHSPDLGSVIISLSETG